ncbi:cyclin-dependent kinase G-2-like [Dorcoceras hygrometricum]|uniref:Cyclin-dependent kinase G-2-like n=1 Tax=Dorcoceras hygrometricum TaxID=472368 RepID=A0A2Z6ZW68_9LAMI|nr:cyclin-dependent kinase G-2-like [Dorcoceras hygrometricum]
MSKNEDEQQMSGISSARSADGFEAKRNLDSAMMMSACLLEVVRVASMTSALLFERNQKSAGAQELVSVVMASAYLLEEAGISNADVSISVEKRRGIRSLLKLLSTDTVRRVTVDKAVGRYYYRSCWQTSPFKREGICD